MISLAQFIKNTEGKYIDIDGAYGSQCWDYSGYYASQVVGCPSFPTGNGTAIGVFNNFLAPLPNYFTKVVNDPNDPNLFPPVGAIVFWTYNHTGVVIDSNSRTMTTLEQDGANDPNQDGIADGVTYRITRGYEYVAGWFVPKNNVGGNMKLNKTGWQQLAHGILGRNGLSGRTNALDGSSDNSDYIGRELDLDLLNELFISGEAKKWRDSNDYASIPDINRRLKTPVIKEVPVEVIKEVIKEVPVEKIVTVTKEVPMGFDKLTFGELISAAFKKLLNIK